MNYSYKKLFVLRDSCLTGSRIIFKLFTLRDKISINIVFSIRTSLIIRLNSVMECPNLV